MLEATLAYLHFIAILSMTVFLGYEAALCHPEWMNGAMLRRLVRVDLIYLTFAVLVLASGTARMVWGAKGLDWYLAQPLLHLKITIFLVMLWLSVRPTLRFRQWVRAHEADGSLPSEPEVRQIRRRIMVSSHLMLLIPLPAVLVARGFNFTF